MIIFYRDGVGESQFDLVMKHEIPSILEAFKSIHPNYSPKFAEIIVTKRIDDRFFFGKKKSAINPFSGTIISDTVVSRKYFDFFLIAQNVTIGTVTATKYTVLYNNTDLT